MYVLNESVSVVLSTSSTTTTKYYLSVVTGQVVNF